MTADWFREVLTLMEGKAGKTDSDEYQMTPAPLSHFEIALEVEPQVPLPGVCRENQMSQLLLEDNFSNSSPITDANT